MGKIYWIDVFWNKDNHNLETLQNDIASSVLLYYSLTWTCECRLAYYLIVMKLFAFFQSFKIWFQNFTTYKNAFNNRLRWNIKENRLKGNRVENILKLKNMFHVSINMIANILQIFHGNKNPENTLAKPIYFINPLSDLSWRRSGVIFFVFVIVLIFTTPCLASRGHLFLPRDGRQLTWEAT